ncbi:Speckle-type POZ protein [Hordeum vulgare]|nr:Speckle-type POZ protein [Hordeum vulgare]
MTSQLEAIPMSLDFTKHFSSVPWEFKLKMNTSRSWRVTIRLLNDRVALDQGWATFTAVHQIKICLTVTFKLSRPNMLNVIVFNDDGIKVVTRCGKHHKDFDVNP